MQRRALAFDNFEQVIADIETLRTRGYRRLKVWSLTQMCDHFTLMAEQSMRGVRFRMPWLLQVIVGRPLVRRFLRTGRMPSVKAPKALAPTAVTEADDAATIERCKAALRRVAACREFAPHPFAGAVEPEVWQRLQLIHCAHHLSFLVPDDAGGSKPA